MGEWKCVNCGKQLKQPGKYCMARPCRRVYSNKYILGRLSSDKGFRDRFYASQKRYYLKCRAEKEGKVVKKGHGGSTHSPASKDVAQERKAIADVVAGEVERAVKAAGEGVFPDE
jgi:hypothetical protein